MEVWITLHSILTNELYIVLLQGGVMEKIFKFKYNVDINFTDKELEAYCNFATSEENRIKVTELKQSEPKEECHQCANHLCFKHPTPQQELDSSKKELSEPLEEIEIYEHWGRIDKIIAKTTNQIIRRLNKEITNDQ